MYEDLTKAELYEIAQELDIHGRSTMTAEELREAVSEESVEEEAVEEGVEEIEASPTEGAAVPSRSVELLRTGSVSGEYIFKTKGTNENGWTVSAPSLEEAYKKAETIPLSLRS